MYLQNTHFYVTHIHLAKPTNKCGVLALTLKHNALQFYMVIIL